MPLIRAAIFDIDGTLADTTPMLIGAWALAVRRTAGISVPRRSLVRLMGYSAEETVAELGIGPPALRAAAKEEFARILEESSYFREARLFPGTRRALGLLKRSGIRLAIVSAGTREKVDRLLSHLRLGGIFDATVSSEDCPGGKVSGRPFWLACRRLDVKPGETVCIGDGTADAAGARKAGCVAVAVLVSRAPRRSLAEAGADYFVRDVSALPALIRRLLRKRR